MDPADDVSAGERALAGLLRSSRLAAADQVPGLAADAARHLGASDLTVLLVDHAQAALVHFPKDDSEPLSIEGTVAGRAFRSVTPVEVPLEDGWARLHVPLLDSVDRLGVVVLTVAADRSHLAQERILTFCSQLAEVLVSKQSAGDSLQRAARLRRMTLAGEVQWALLPPLTVATDRVVVAGMLEPCYDVGGDVIDYSVGADDAHVAIFDAMGHDLDATMLASVAVGAYRNGRRHEHSLEAIADGIEAAVARQFRQEQLVTGVLLHLDVASGRLRWVNAGHPPPLLLRGGHVVKVLAGPTEPLFGMGLRTGTTVHEEALEPGDRVLMYTDGVVEARDAEGRQFGLERLVDIIVSAEAAGLQVPETMRRVSKAVVEHGHSGLSDDATHVLVEWLTGEPERLVL